jgi:hypothetical protein
MSRLFGPVRQNGYVVRDIEAAMKHWIEVMGVGPFFYFPTVKVEEFTYYGKPSDIQMSIALANSGSLQIELIQQRNDAPSMYRDFLAAGREGLQHVAFWTERFDEDMARYRAAGFEPAQEGRFGGRNGRLVYFSAEAHPGTVIELSEISGPKGPMFRRIAEAAAAWDGSDPIRSIASL